MNADEIHARIRQAMDTLREDLRSLREQGYEVECVANDADGRITVTVLIGVFVEPTP